MRLGWALVIALSLPLTLSSGCAVVVGAAAVTQAVKMQNATAPKRERKLMADLTPPVLVADAAWAEPIRTVKVHVWADDDYRVQNRHWTRRFQEQLDYANEVLGALLGIKLDPDYRVWNRRAGPDVQLDESLTALRALDPGTDAFVVIGLTSSIPLIAGSYDKLGVATVDGPYMMLRGHSDVEERAAFERVFVQTREADRDRLYELRRRHKTAATLLHELAHTLGVRHNRDDGMLMSARYSHKVASFHPGDRDAMLVAVERRLGGPQIAPVIFDAADAEAAAAAGPLVIVIIGADAYSVGGTRIASKDLDELLRRRVITAPDSAVTIEADPTLSPELVSKMMSRVYAVGFVQVSISIPEPEPAPGP